MSLNWLNGFLHQNLDLPGLSDTRIPNPKEWVRAVSLYLQLASESPTYAVKINTERAEGLLRKGVVLQKALQNINSRNEGGRIIPNYGLFNAVIKKYRDALANLQNKSQEMANGITTDTGSRLNGLNLWGGAEQQTNYVPSVLTDSSYRVPPCKISYRTFRVPVDLNMLLPPQVRLAEKLGLGKVDFCYEPEMASVEEVLNEVYRQRTTQNG